MNTMIDLLHTPSVERLGWVLIHFLWEGATIALLLAAILSFLTRASSHIRYLVICGALLAAVVAPVATWMVLPHNEGVSQFTPPSRVDANFAVSGPLAHEAAQDRAKISNTINVAGSEPARATSLRLHVLGMLNRSLPFAVAFWFAGVLILTMRLAFGWRGVRRLRRSGVAISNRDWEEKLSALCCRMIVAAPVRLCQSALVEVPTLIGWLRPMILLPGCVLTGLESRQLEAILAHELAHIRHCDYLVNVIQTVIETALFYHPAIWWISRKMREERENCCDDMAIQTIRDRKVYAGALAALEEIRASAPPLALAASGGLLIARIRRLGGGDCRKGSSAPIVAAILVLGSLVVPIATELAAGQGTPSPSPAAPSIASPSPQHASPTPSLTGSLPSPANQVVAPSRGAPFLNVDLFGTPKVDSSGAVVATGQPIIGKGPESVLGIKWGASPTEAKAAIAKQPGFAAAQNKRDDRLFYSGGEFAGLRVEMLVLEFSNNHFSKATITFKYPLRVLDENGLWSDDGIGAAIQNELIKKYGLATTNQQDGEQHTRTWAFADNPKAKTSTQIGYNRNWSARILQLTYTNFDVESTEIPTGVPKINPADL